MNGRAPANSDTSSAHAAVAPLAGARRQPPRDAPADPSITLVMATRGRSDDIGRLLDSLRLQRVPGLELVIVDQNGDDRVTRLLESRREDQFTIRLLESPPGVSRGRNLGLANARGAIVGFPDDDCWFPPGLLQSVLAWFSAHPQADGLSCRVTDERGRASAGGFMSARAQWIAPSNVWRTLVSPGLFIRRRADARIGGFDERLGVGAATPWGSGEESDYVLRAVACGAALHYDPRLIVLHPVRAEPLCWATLGRAWRYGRGMGFVLRKNGYGVGAAAYFASLSFGSALLSLVRLRPGRALARVVMSAGRLAGWMSGAREPVGPPPAPVPGSNPASPPAPAGSRPLEAVSRYTGAI